MATTYDELKAEIQDWLDNNNPNLIAAIPSMIDLAERVLNRRLRVREQLCRSSHPLVPSDVTDATRGIYALPDDWAGHDTVERIDELIWINYFQSFPTLTDINQTNWLLDRHADLYLWSSLLNAEPWLKNDSRIAVWRQRRDDALTEIANESIAETFSGGPLQSRHARRYPWRYNTGSGRLEYMFHYDFFDLLANSDDWTVQREMRGQFTTFGNTLRIWPVPTEDPGADPSGWSACS